MTRKITGANAQSATSLATETVSGAVLVFRDTPQEDQVLSFPDVAPRTIGTRQPGPLVALR
jgi:hypothetical protein